jgi:transcriptional regulator with XRE-family HTH domain
MPRKRDVDLLTAIGARIRSARRAAGLTQEAVGERLGIQPTTISRIETGSTGPSLRMLADLADICGVPVGRFFAQVPPTTAAVTDEEHDLVAQWRQLDRSHQAQVLRLMRWARHDAVVEEGARAGWRDEETPEGT